MHVLCIPVCQLALLLLSDELLKYTKWFYSLSKDVRMTLARKNWNPQNPNGYRGYYPTVPGVTCFKEGIEFGQERPPDDPDILSDNYMYEANVWPPLSLPGASEFKKFILSYYQSMTEMGLEITHLLAIGLGKEENYFDELFLRKPLSTLRLMHYPVREEPISEAAKRDGLVLTCVEHTDSTFMTFLSTFYNPGLQVLLKDGSWVDVAVRPECLVMNAGDALVKTTGGRFKATRHRVVDHGKERYSVPFFIEPNYYGDIGRFEKELQQSNGVDTARDDVEPTLYGPWVDKTMKEKNFSDFPTDSLGK